MLNLACFCGSSCSGIITMTWDRSLTLDPFQSWLSSYSFKAIKPTVSYLMHDTGLWITHMMNTLLKNPWYTIACLLPSDWCFFASKRPFSIILLMSTFRLWYMCLFAVKSLMNKNDLYSYLFILIFRNIMLSLKYESTWFEESVYLSIIIKLHCIMFVLHYKKLSI